MLRSILRAYAVIVTVQIIYYWCRLSYFLREECLAENGNFCFLLSRIYEIRLYTETQRQNMHSNKANHVCMAMMDIL